MSGLTNLSELLSSLEPELLSGEYVFATVEEERLPEFLPFRPMGMFLEAEGLTLILPKHTADRFEITTSAPLRCITMNVHSSIEAVGMTAAMAAALTDEGISANVVAAYYHDHIFVPSVDADRAVAALQRLSASFK